MVKKIVVVHPKCIEDELRRTDLPQHRRVEAERALRLCNEAVVNAKNLVVTDDLEPSQKKWGRLKKPAKEGDVYLLKGDDTVFLRDCMQKGDEVEIMGAYRDLCVNWAKNDCEKAGARVTVSAEGTFHSGVQRRK